MLSGRATGAAKTKDGLADAIRALGVVYHSPVKDRTRAINQFKALLVTAPEPLRANLRPLAFSAQLQTSSLARMAVGSASVGGAMAPAIIPAMPSHAAGPGGAGQPGGAARARPVLSAGSGLNNERWATSLMGLPSPHEVPGGERFRRLSLED